MDRPRHAQDDRTFTRRFGLGMFAGLLLGALTGATAGLVIGIVSFGAGTIGLWLTLIAAVVGGSWIGWFLGGLGSLETPPPSEEPSETPASGQDEDEAQALRIRVRPRWPERTGRPRYGSMMAVGQLPRS